MKNIQQSTQSTEIYKSLKKLRAEEDSSLPDYCSDIVRVVRTRCTPIITSKKTYMRDDMLVCEISGSVVFNVVYVTENGILESHSFTTDFFDTSKSDAADVDEDSVYAFVSARSMNEVCKVQSPRRISMRADVCLDVLIRANKSFECYSKDDSPVETREKDCNVLRISSSKDTEFNVSEEIKLPKNCPPMERILFAELSVVADEVKAGDNSVNFWGSAGISCMYIPESESESTIQAFYQPLDVKGRIEMEDSSCDMNAIVRLSPSLLKYEIVSDDLGENKILRIDFSYTAQCLTEENSSIILTTDIYGIGRDVSPLYDKREFCKFVGALRESTAIKEKLPLKKGVERLEGAKADVSLKDTYFENGELFANCSVLITAVGIGEESPCPISESFDIALHLNLPSEVLEIGDDLVFDIEQSTGFVDTRVDEGDATVSFDVNTRAQIYRSDISGYVARADVGEEKETSSNMLFYYPAEGDDLWTVGKRYGVGMKRLAEANSMSDGDALKRVMIIPG